MSIKNIFGKVFKGKKIVKDRSELKEIVNERISENPQCDLNDLDVSNVTDMFMLFANTDFNGDISTWDVSNVTDMTAMFYNCPFNGDISTWDVSKVMWVSSMFNNDNFSQDISTWSLNALDKEYLFVK